MSEEKTRAAEFHAWFKKQSHRDDAVGWVAKWFLHKGQGRYPKHSNLNPTCDHWLKIVAEKASKAHQLAARSAFITAWNEFHAGLQVEGTVEELEADVMSVRPTVARLRRVVKGNHERGEVEEEEEIGVSRFKGPVATVGIRQRLTTSYGGDWVQLGVMLSVPCYPEEIESAFEFADQWVTDKIQTEVDKFRGGGPPARPSTSQDGATDEEQDQGDEESGEELGEESGEELGESVGEESPDTDEGLFDDEPESETKDGGSQRETFKLEPEPEDPPLCSQDDYGI